MRLRRKPNLESRLARAGSVFVTDPAALRGNWKTEFGGLDELHIELGCGKGRFTAEAARQKPRALFVGVERVLDALVVAMERAADAAPENVRFIAADAETLGEIFAPGEVSRIYINFCDPWPRPRTAKRRLTSPGFIGIYREILAPGGEVWFKTDSVPLFEYSLKSFGGSGFTVTDVTRDLHRDGAAGIMTDYEARFFEHGVAVCRLTAIVNGQWIIDN